MDSSEKEMDPMELEWKEVNEPWKNYGLEDWNEPEKPSKERNLKKKKKKKKKAKKVKSKQGERRDLAKRSHRRISPSAMGVLHPEGIQNNEIGARGDER